MASSADTKAELRSKDNPITEGDAPPSATEEGSITSARVASSADTKAELGSKENPITEDDAPPTATEEAEEVPAVDESGPNERLGGAVLGGIVEIYKFHVQNLINLMKTLLNVNRKIGFGIKNKTPFALESTEVHFHSGTSDGNISRTVPPNFVLEWAARKSKLAARGAIGTFSYYMPAVDKTLHVMYQVPYDFHLYENWWNATVVNGRHGANKDIHWNLYHGLWGMPAPFRAGSWRERPSNGFILIGNMTTNGEAILELEIAQA